MLAYVSSVIFRAPLITWIGRYWPFLLLDPLISAIDAGLLYILIICTSSAKLIGFQMLYGSGVGAAMQMHLLRCIRACGRTVDDPSSDVCYSVLPTDEAVLGNSYVRFLCFLSSLWTQMQAILAYLSSLDYVFIVSSPA